MPCYKIPQAYVPPPQTIAECNAFKHKIKQEKKLTYGDASKRCASLPDLHRAKNSYFSFFRDERLGDIHTEHRFTYDQIKDTTVFDPKSGKDSFHTNHSEAIRKRCAKPNRTRWMITSSQAYGWMPPLDDGKHGFSRPHTYHRDSMDQSHLSLSHASS
eukprot:CAMPEP_0206579758 /NCGR_PEP_ID=MMETSP0325_2-20121206/32747_1 /ASSEMBLY_ACC=CAM_ASM_000347 /TAXON_ID=2866 /ORGANISM="Crypthecodinium cohnii, Strain Seligo" /LENGTH=157 /DNA_ID=CAMNT_0054085645 /DNA_START=140 /DNA_END=609 /DNA_ORIENTATION=-